MKTELNFILKVLRNALILSGMYFCSVWVTAQSLDFITHIKPILIFLFMYVLTECAKRYKLDYKNPNIKNKPITTLIL